MSVAEESDSFTLFAVKMAWDNPFCSPLLFTLPGKFESYGVVHSCQRSK